ncbi:vitellogenin-6-like [Tubulanus polymorphus]|uniref:vitellogenin-6-like n=1 Tax=Tubulanus polymorphus TaxID=672921 RepID=UPI003DA28C71
MKVVLLCMIGIGLATGLLEESSKRVFQPNHEFVFDNEVQIVTGLPELSRASSGLKIRSVVRVQFLEGDRVVLKMTAPRIYILNREIPTHQTISSLLPDRIFMELTESIAEKLRADLIKPVSCRFVDGAVSDVHVSEGDAIWSVNIKKALLSLLQVDLEGENTIADQNIHAHLYKKSFSKHSEFKAFKVMEESTVGSCETFYSQWAAPVMSGADSGLMVVNLTKTVDHNRCSSVPLMEKSNIKGRNCNDIPCANKAWIVKPGTTIHYKLYKSGRKFMVDTAEVRSQLVLSPVNDKMGSITTFIHQSTRLTAIHTISRPISVPTMKPASEGLRMIIPGIMGATVPMQAPSATVTEIERIIRLISALPETELPKPEWIITLIKELRKCPLTTLNSLIKPYLQPSIENPSHMRVRRIVLNLLPTLRTMPALRLIKASIQSQLIKDASEMSFILSTIPVTYEPMPEYITEILAICKDPSVMKQVQPKQTCWLAAGALIHRLVISNQPRPSSSDIHQRHFGNILVEGQITAQRLNALKRHYSQEILALFRAAQSEPERLLALKVIGNSGLVELVPYVEKTIADMNAPKILRVKAMYALPQMAKFIPRKIQSILMPYLLNPVEPTELRIAAYSMIMETEPEFALIETVANNLRKEQNLHVASYIYNHMKHVSRSTQPCYQSLAVKLKRALHFAKPIALNILLPQRIHLPYNFEKLGFSAALDMTLISTTKSFLPQSGNIKIKTYMLGHSVDLFSASLYTEGLQNMLEKLIGPYGSVHKSKSILDVLKPRGKRSISPEDELNNIRNKVNMKSVKQEEFKGAMYVSMFGHDLRMFTMDKEVVRTIFESGKIRIGNIESELRNGKSWNVEKTMVLEDAMVKVPTFVGLPVSLNLTALAHLELKSQVSLRVEPSIFKEKRTQAMPQFAKATIIAKPNLVTDVELTMGVAIPFLRAGTKATVQLLSNTPINAEVKYTWATRKIEISVPTIQQELRLIDLHVKPVTFVETITPGYSGAHKSVDIKDIVSQGSNPAWQIQPENLYSTQKKTMSFGKNSLGIEFVAEIEATSRPDASLSEKICPWTGMKSMRIFARPGHMTPEKIVIESTCNPSSVPMQQSSQSSQSGESESTGQSSWSWLWSTSGEKSESTEDQINPAAGSTQSSWKKTNVEAAVKIMGIRNGQTERYVKLEMNIHSAGALTKNIRVNIIRSPLPNYAATPFKICAKGVYRHPQLPVPTFTQPLPASEISRTMTWEYMWGEECTDSKKIWMQVHFEKSQEQQEFEQKRLFESLPEYQICQKERRAGSILAPSCMRLKKFMYALNQMKVEIHYPITEVPLPLWRVAHVARHYLRNWLFARSWIRDTGISNTPGQVVIHAKFLPEMYKTYWKLQTPTAVEEYSHIPMMFDPTALIPSSHPYEYNVLWKHLSNFRLPAKCQLTAANEVMTFDGMFAKVPSVPCEMVLAADATPQPKMAVTATIVPQSNMKIVKVIVDGRIIVVRPSQSSTVSPVIEINGEPISILREQTFIIRRQPNNPSSRIILSIRISKAGVVVINSQISLLTVKTNLKDVIVKPSPFWFSNIRGLCGDFNMEKTADMSKPTGEPVWKPEVFVHSWFLPSQRCTVAPVAPAM